MPDTAEITPLLPALAHDAVPFDDRARARLDVDLTAFRANIARCRTAVRPSILSAVVKSDAYGVGLADLLPVFLESGCRQFWVNDLEEAAALLTSAPQGLPHHSAGQPGVGAVYALHGLCGYTGDDFEAVGAIPVIGCADEAMQLAHAGRQRGRPYRAALQIDTGLARLGLSEQDLRALFADPWEAKPCGIKPAVYLTHLAWFYDPQDPRNAAQRRRLLDWTKKLPSAPLSVSSSGTAFLPTAWHLDLARVGTALLGLQATRIAEQALTPVLSYSAPIIRVAALPTGYSLGYGALATLERDSLIATLALGYADGLPQEIGRSGTAFIDGHEVPFLGGMSMNLSMLDVTDLPTGVAEPGKRVEIFGPNRSLDRLAEELGILQNALLLSMSARAVKRAV